MAATETLSLAIAHHQAGKLAQAEALYRQVLEQQPQQADALHFLGVISHQTGQLEDAVVMISRAIAAAPAYAAAHSNLGNVLRDQGRMDEAIASYRRALALDPDLAEAHFSLGNALRRSGRQEEAIASYRRAIARRPDYPDAHNNLGNALRDVGQYDAAIASYRRAIALRTDYPEAHNNLGNVLRQSGQSEAAVACYRRAVELRPDNAGFHGNLGYALKESSLVEEAISAFRRAAELRPDLPEYGYVLAGLTGNGVVLSAPESYVRTLFDDYADRYDSHLVGQLRYRTPELLLAAVTAAAPGRKFDVLDLGCGTGLSGLVFRHVALGMTGVDLAPKMIGKAAARGIYDRLMTTDLMTAMKDDSGRYDLVLSSDVFIYVGELATVFPAVARALRPGGLFAFSVEKHDGDGIVLRQSARFAHSLSYLRGLARDNALAEDLVQEVVLRQEGGEDIAGWIVVLRKPMDGTARGQAP